MKPLRVAALVKQIPKFEAMSLGTDGRLKRDGVELSMNPYCQRALSKGIELAQATAGQCTVISLGPPAAEDVIRWGVAAGADNGILISDPAFAGSDTLATAKALARVLEAEGPFDVILVGKNAVDADTGQVGPELAELLGLPFVAAVRSLEFGQDGALDVGCEHDDAWVEAEVPLPAVLSTAERLCRPAKVDDPEKALVPAEKIRTVTSVDLGDGPWGADGSPTRVGETRIMEVKRDRRMLSGAPESQVAEAMTLLQARRVFSDQKAEATLTVGGPVAKPVTVIAVLLEPGNTGSARELLGLAAQLAPQIGASVTGIQAESAADATPEEIYCWGADRLCVLNNGSVEEDIAHFVASWCQTHAPRFLFAPSTSWGREVAARVAARTGSGLTGDAIALECADGELVSWKPAFGGRLVAAIRSISAIQMATVRPGVLPRPAAREGRTPSIERHCVELTSRLRVVSRRRNDQLDALAMASRVVGVGMGIPPERYPELDPMLDVLGAELATTRKVTDKGWLPHARQVGITGRSIAPSLYIGVAVSGNFNHACGIQAAGTVLAINSDPGAAIFEHADIGIVADWANCVPLLAKAFGELLPNGR